MKNLVDYIDESLIKSYDTEKLKNALNKKYGIENFHDHKSKSDEPKRFALSVDKDLYNRLSNQSRLLSADFSSEYFALKVLKVYETAIENYKKDNKKIINKIKNNIASRKYKKISEKN